MATHAFDPGDHGKTSTYRHGCRCTDCRAANAAASRQRRSNSKADPTRADRAGHGKAATYSNHGCRCEPCTDAHMERLNAAATPS